MWLHLVNWIVKHHKWIDQISKDILNMKKRKLVDHLQDVVQPNFKLDEIALMIYACMCHLDLAVILHKSYWCAAIHDDIYKAKVIFAFKGKLTFSATRPMQGIFRVGDKI